jgi:Flp pilus assembly protein TadG
MVEFALVIPIFALMLFAMIDFGLVFGGYVTLRGGVQAAARAASVDQYQAPAGCSGNTPTTQLVCLVAARVGNLVGVTSNQLSVGVSLQGGQTANGTAAVEICASANLKSTTGLTAPFLNGRTVSTSSTVLLERNADYSSFNSGTVTYGTTTISGIPCP